jgi:predicted deacetylase
MLSDQPDKGIPSLISVHDVMPETLASIRVILAGLSRRTLSPITLLVVPGKSWNLQQIAELRELKAQGVILAGHGWSHRTVSINGFRHRLHSALISQQAAEHLCLNRPQISELISRCHRWFVDHELGVPTLYVPPAWAMGPLRPEDLQRLPFRLYETLQGVYDSNAQRYIRLPLVGFEAQSPSRAPLLRLSNRLNLSLARADRPVRFSIHPGDLSLPLAHDLLTLLDRPLHCLHYGELAQSR